MRPLRFLTAALALCACGSNDPPPPPDATLALDAAADVPADAPPDRVRVIPTDWPRTPPPFPAYSRGACPTLRAGPDEDSALNADFATGAHRRQFRLVVPRNYDPAGGDRWPLVFAWHWLAGDSRQMVREGDLAAAAERYRAIFVVPDQLRVNGEALNAFTWPLIDRSLVEPELVFFDDMLACVASQLRVDPARVHGMGVSAGALWLTSLASTTRVRHLASVAILSGGLGEVLNAWRMEYAPQPEKYPALVLWGGPTDRLVVDFHLASQRLRDALVDDGHFVVTCTHDRGHALPPLMAPAPGESRFAVLWHFFNDHPYGIAPATSPYLARGLPPSAPPWCSIPPELLADARDR